MAHVTACESSSAEGVVFERLSKTLFTLIFDKSQKGLFCSFDFMRRKNPNISSLFP